MQTIIVNTWTAYKALIASKALSIQYEESDTDYKLYVSEAGVFLWMMTLNKDSGSDVTDFETNFKPAANQPLESKAAMGRPERVAPSPQPNNTTEHWLGFHLGLDAETQSGVLDISFDALVYLRGGIIYSGDCDGQDVVKADVVLKANPAYVVQADLLKDVYMLKNIIVPFLSSECMVMPSSVMLRVTYTKGGVTNTIRSISAMADYFKPNA